MLSNCIHISYLNCLTYICYHESRNLYISGCSGSYKVRTDNTVHILLSGMHVSINYSYSFSGFRASMQHLLHCFATAFIGTRFGYPGKYKIKGLGHRLHYRSNQMIFKLGYSHVVYRLLDLDITSSPKRHKKKPYFAVRGINSTKLHNSLSILKNFRVPDVYCLNGISVRTELYVRKEGKKSFMLQFYVRHTHNVSLPSRTHIIRA